MESGAGLRPANRHRPEQLSPQRVGAVAAVERDHPAAVTVRVPHHLPDDKDDRTGCEVQTAMPDFTHCAPAARCYRCTAALVHTLPHFFASVCTRYRRSSHADACAGVRGNGASLDSLPRAHGPVVLMLPLCIDDRAPRGGASDSLTATATANSSNIVAREALCDSGPLEAGSHIVDDRQTRCASCSLQSVTASCRAQWGNRGSEQAQVHNLVGQGAPHRAPGARVPRAR